MSLAPGRGGRIATLSRPVDQHQSIAAVIRWGPARADKRTPSKRSRALRYAKMEKEEKEPFAEFVKRRGGINECVARCGRCLRQLAANRRSIGDFRRRAAKKGGDGWGGLRGWKV